jgi:hypothetical protein
MSDDFRRMDDAEAQAAVTYLRARELGATVAGNTEGADLLRRTARELEAARAGEAAQRRRAELAEAKLAEIAEIALLVVRPAGA